MNDMGIDVFNSGNGRPTHAFDTHGSDSINLFQGVPKAMKKRVITVVKRVEWIYFTSPKCLAPIRFDQKLTDSLNPHVGNDKPYCLLIVRPASRPHVPV